MLNDGSLKKQLGDEVGSVSARLGNGLNEEWKTLQLKKMMKQHVQKSDNSATESNLPTDKVG